MSSALLTFFKALFTLSLGCFSSPGSSSPFLTAGFFSVVAAAPARAAFGLAGAYLAAAVALAAGAATVVALLWAMCLLLTGAFASYYFLSCL
jgi:hypothetical protein